MPGGEDNLVGWSVRGFALVDIARLGWRAARRHAREPGALVAKLRQALSGGSSMVFTAPARETTPAMDYAAWQAAFESETETTRLLEAHRALLGGRRGRLLAIVARWPHGSAALAETIGSLLASAATCVHVLDLDGSCGEGPWASAASFARVAAEAAAPEVEAAIGDAIKRTSADLVLVLDRAGRFHPLAAACLTLALAGDREAHAAYADHDVLDGDQRRGSPVFKPAWSPDYQLAADYVAAPVAFRADLALPAELASIGRGEALPATRLLARLAACSATSRLCHVPRVLFHAHAELAGNDRSALLASIAGKALGGARVVASAVALPAEAGAGRIRVRYVPPKAKLASIIVPTKDNAELLALAWRSVREAEDVASELVVVDNGATSPAQLALLDDIAADARSRVIADHGPFNFSRLINVGRRASRGELIVLLNDDVEALDRGWLAELASQAARPAVGCVGALLSYPDGRVQHAGVLLGVNSGAGHAFRFSSAETPGDGGRLRVVREVSAVTAACLAVRASVFDEVGGFEEALPVTLNDVDFCLKVRAAGYRNVFTPFARLIHRESTSRGLDATPEKLRRLSRETAVFQKRWGGIAVSDPWFGPHMSRTHEDFRPRRM